MSPRQIHLGEVLALGRERAGLIGKAALVGVPLLVGSSLGLRADAAPIVAFNAANPANPTNPGQQDGTAGDGTGAPPPDQLVIPQNGDPQNLATATQAGGAPIDQTQPAPQAGDTTAVAGYTSTGIPIRSLQAYVTAAQTLGRTTPSCHLHWSLLAGVGRVESNHGRFAGATVNADGLVTPSILGPRLDGTRGLPLIKDSDRGALDGDATVERAVGPMQFLPGTWATMGSDADGDGKADPQDLDDAALAAGRYLCLGGTDLATQNGRWNAVLRYNHSSSYAALVIALADSYATGKASPIPSAPAGVAPPKSGSQAATVAASAPVAVPAATPTGTSTAATTATTSAGQTSAAPTNAASTTSSAAPTGGSSTSPTPTVTVTVTTGTTSISPSSSAAPTSSTPTSSTSASASPTTSTSPTSASPTSASPTSASPTSASPTSASPTSTSPTSASPTSASPTSASPTSASPTSASPTSASPTSASPTASLSAATSAAPS